MASNKYSYASNGSKIYTREQLDERNRIQRIRYANNEGGYRKNSDERNRSRKPTREQLDERNRRQKIKYASDEEYRKKNTDRFQAWKMENPEWARQYRKDNSERINTRWKADYHKKKKVVHNLLGNKCKNCGEDDPIYHQIDHVNNDGHIEGYDIYAIKKYLETPERYQLLCANCNWAKRMNGGQLYKPKRRKPSAKRN